MGKWERKPTLFGKFEVRQQKRNKKKIKINNDNFRKKQDQEWTNECVFLGRVARSRRGDSIKKASVVQQKQLNKGYVSKSLLGSGWLIVLD